RADLERRRSHAAELGLERGGPRAARVQLVGGLGERLGALRGRAHEPRQVHAQLVALARHLVALARGVLALARRLVSPAQGLSPLAPELGQAPLERGRVAAARRRRARRLLLLVLEPQELALELGEARAAGAIGLLEPLAVLAQRR